MNARIWSWLLVAAAGCAPVALPAPTPKTDAPAPPVETIGVRPKPEKSPLKARIELAVDQIRRRELQTNHAFWTIFHGILGLGPTLELTEPDTHRRVNALDYICSGRGLRGQEFRLTERGYDVGMSQLGVSQGHQDQFIAEMAQWGMPLDHKFRIEGRDATFREFVHHSQMRASTTENQELSWAIVVIGQYMGTDVAWNNAKGERLTFDDVVRYELAAPIEDAACGGTHRLFGLSWAYHLHRKKNARTEGVWADVVSKTAAYRDRAKAFQNGDGSFSTDFFRGRGNVPDPALRINTSGHTFEWLALALSDDELHDRWMEEAAAALALMIIDIGDRPMEGGALYHAVHGLLIYYARVFGPDQLGPLAPPVPLPPRDKGERPQ